MMLSIGELGRRTDTKVETIRYYERIGLLTAPARTEGNYRAYGEAELNRLSFIRRARDLGFSIEQVRDLLVLSDRRDQSCATVDELTRTHLAEVERKIADLEAPAVPVSAGHDLGLSDHRGAGAEEGQRGLPAFMGLGFDDRLATLLDAEASSRDDRRLKRLLKFAKLKVAAMPEDIDFRNGRGLDRAQIAALLSCDWIERGRNGIITGPCGAGKTWLACAIGMQAARNGVPVLYFRVSLLLEAMALAHQDGSAHKLRASLAKAKLLILDDFGLSRFLPRGKQDLLEILDARVGVSSTIIAGQLPFQDWHDHIDEPALADAILDRIMHSSFKMELTGESMRKFKARG